MNHILSKIFWFLCSCIMMPLYAQQVIKKVNSAPQVASLTHNHMDLTETESKYQQELQRIEQEDQQVEEQDDEETPAQLSTKTISGLGVLSVPTGLASLFLTKYLPTRQKTRFDPFTMITSAMAAKYIAGAAGGLLILWYIKRCIGNLLYGQYKERLKALQQRNRAKRKALAAKYKQKFEQFSKELRAENQNHQQTVAKDLKKLEAVLQAKLEEFGAESKQKAEATQAAVQELRAGAQDLQTAHKQIPHLQKTNQAMKETLAKILPALQAIQITVAHLGQQKSQDDLALTQQSKKTGAWYSAVKATRGARQALGLAKPRDSSSDKKDAS